MALITVVIPIYNMAHYLPRCFDCLTSQTFTDWQAILVDDGSPDDSGRICDEQAAKDKRFRVIHKPNGGVCSARNAGMLAAETPFVTLLDQDDLLSPFALEAALAAQNAYPEAFIHLQYTEEREKLTNQLPSKEKYRLYQPCEAGFLYNESPFPPPWCKLYKTDLLRRNNLLFDETIRDGYEDRPFVRAYLKAHWAENPQAPCVLINRPLYFWEQENAGSVSKRPNKPLTEAHFRMFDGFVQDCIQVYRTPLISLQYVMLEYIQTIAFGISCLPKENRDALMEPFYALPEYARLVEYFPAAKFYSVFYGAFRRKNTALIVRLSQGRLNNDTFYWRLYKLGRLCHPTWADWHGIDAIPRK